MVCAENLSWYYSYMAFFFYSSKFYAFAGEKVLIKLFLKNSKDPIEKA